MKRGREGEREGERGRERDSPARWITIIQRIPILRNELMRWIVTEPPTAVGASTIVEIDACSWIV
jgi:hypothetical protein